MTIHICRSQGKQFVIVDPESLNLAYSLNILNDLVREIETPAEMEKINEYDFDQTINPIVRRVKELFEKYVPSIRKIADRLGLNAEGEGLVYCRNFKKILLGSDVVAERKLDLSGLDLDLVPFVISFFSSTTEIDLSNNNLRILPDDLKLMPNLQIVRLANNPLRNTKNLKKMENIEIITDPPESDRNKWAQIDFTAQ